MANSQNLRFYAFFPADSEDNGPPGAALMRKISAHLADKLWTVDEMVNWRDCGWSIICRTTYSTLEIVLSEVRSGEWMLQISPFDVPGFLRMLFGAKVSATESEIHELAISVHNFISLLPECQKLRWRWDGFPDDDSSTSEPRGARV